MKINRQGYERVHLRAGTRVVVVTGRFLFLGKGDKQVDLFSGGYLCTYPSR